MLHLINPLWHTVSELQFSMEGKKLLCRKNHCYRFFGGAHRHRSIPLGHKWMAGLQNMSPLASILLVLEPRQILDPELDTQDLLSVFGYKLRPSPSNKQIIFTVFSDHPVYIYRVSQKKGLAKVFAPMFI